MIGFSCHGLSTTSEKTLAGYCRFLLLQSKFFPNIADNERRHENEDHHAQFAPARHARESRGLFFFSPARSHFFSDQPERALNHRNHDPVPVWTGVCVRSSPSDWQPKSPANRQSLMLSRQRSTDGRRMPDVAERRKP
jgi:hypothetical protein